MLLDFESSKVDEIVSMLKFITNERNIINYCDFMKKPKFTWWVSSLSKHRLHTP